MTTGEAGLCVSCSYGMLLCLSRPLRAGPTAAIEQIAGEIDAVVAIGSLCRADRFEAPERIWDHLQTEFPTLVAG